MSRKLRKQVNREMRDRLADHHRLKKQRLKDYNEMMAAIRRDVAAATIAIPSVEQCIFVQRTLTGIRVDYHEILRTHVSAALELSDAEVCNGELLDALAYVTGALLQHCKKIRLV